MGLYYERQLEAKIGRQKKEIKRLLKENAELKKKYKGLNKVLNEFNNIVSEPARTEGQEEAWKLALKLRYMDYEDKVECFSLEYDGKEKWIEVMEKYTYAEAAEKVAEWEKAKEEICVGDVVEVNGLYAIVTYEYEEFASIVHADGQTYFGRKDVMTKTGRHIDVNAWLAQIGGGSDETKN